MAVNGANDKPKTLEEYQELAKTAAQDNDAATVKQKISIFSDGAWKLEQQIAPNGIDKNEMPILQQWINMLSSYTNKLSDSIKKACKDAIDRLDEVIENLKEMALGANQTDAAQIKENPNSLMVPERMFNGDRFMKEDYDICFKQRSNRLIASKLKIFQAKYEDELRKSAASIPTYNGYNLINLYNQIEQQIIHYNNLADKENNGNNQASGKKITGKDKTQAANQKKHTREDFINDLIRIGYTKSEAEKIADKNDITS